MELSTLDESQTYRIPYRYNWYCCDARLPQYYCIHIVSSKALFNVRNLEQKNIRYWSKGLTKGTSFSGRLLVLLGVQGFWSLTGMKNFVHHLAWIGDRSFIEGFVTCLQFLELNKGWCLVDNRLWILGWFCCVLFWIKGSDAPQSAPLEERSFAIKKTSDCQQIP